MIGGIKNIYNINNSLMHIIWIRHDKKSYIFCNPFNYNNKSPLIDKVLHMTNPPPVTNIKCMMMCNFSICALQ